MRFKIKIEPGTACNLEYAPPLSVQEGIDCEGYLTIAFDGDGEPLIAFAQNISVNEVADAICCNKDDELVGLIRRACAIAEGRIKAKDIFDESQKNKTGDVFKKMILEILSGMMSGVGLEDEDI